MALDPYPLRCVHNKWMAPKISVNVSSGQIVLNCKSTARNHMHGMDRDKDCGLVISIFGIENCSGKCCCTQYSTVAKPGDAACVCAQRACVCGLWVSVWRCAALVMCAGAVRLTRPGPCWPVCPADPCWPVTARVRTGNKGQVTHLPVFNAKKDFYVLKSVKNHLLCIKTLKCDLWYRKWPKYASVML